MSSESEQIRLAVIDPGLLEPAGHHAGFASVIAGSLSRVNAAFEVKVLANQRVDTGLVEQLTQAGVSVEPFFKVDFYRYYDADENIVTIRQYIFKLSRYYLRGFKYLVEAWGKDRQIVLLYHTLSWEHAAALSMAIRLSGDEGRVFRHEVFLMFPPGMNRQGAMYDKAVALNYRTAFAALARTPGVNLSASCSEYAKAYRYLLSCHQDLPIHPCFLADWEALEPAKKSQSTVDLSSAQVLLYLGDAKEAKGFLQLPKLVREWQALLGDQARIVIHFTHCWDNDKVKAVSAMLQQMAAEDERINIVNTFLDDKALHGLIQRCNLAVLNYDNSVYQYKSSGVLWLFAFYRVSLVVLGTGWVLREAVQLGLSVIIKRSAESVLSRIQNGVLHFDDRRVGNAHYETYRAQLFQSFWDYLSTSGRAVEA